MGGRTDRQYTLTLITHTARTIGIVDQEKTTTTVIHNVGSSDVRHQLLEMRPGETMMVERMK